MIALAAVMGFLLAWAMRLLGALLARRAGRETGPAACGPALVRLVLDRSQARSLAPLAGVEVAGALFGGLWLALFGLTWGVVPAALWFCFFVLVASTDVLARWVPNVLVYPAAALALAGHLWTGDQSLPVTLLGGALAFGVFALAAWVKPGGLGGGDVKLAGVIGLLFGFPNVLWALLLGGALGALVAAALLIGKWGAKSMRIPYAPFLCIGAVSALLYSPIPSLLKV
jgi:leader peptidase (prepilin peptidase)/N-methyltransferase